ncbi:MAG: S9 family peptidase [Phycisphaerae bacterium]|nr:S9 family peptidase [Phycisphaerae bacterium]
MTFETLYGPQRVNFSGHYATGMRWLPDGQHFLHRRDGILQKVDAVSDEATPAYDHEAFQTALADHEDFDEAAARWAARRPTILSDDHAVAVVEHDERLYFYRFADQTLTCLTKAAGERRALTLSPDQTHVAFVVDNNIYTINIASGQQKQLTHDGSDTVLNGVLDWLYQEEVFGRGQWRSYWWSEDGRYLAYLQLDERDVPLYPLYDYLSTHPEDLGFPYPKAGDPNPKPCLGVVRPAGGETVWVDPAQYDGTEIIILGVTWSPDGRLLYCVKDRESRWLDLNVAPPETGQSRTLLRETTPAWVDYYDSPHWLADGSFLWFSARDGWQHLYHYTRDGQLIRRVTAGEWEARTLHGVDEERGWVYFSGTRDSHVETHAYRVPLTGGDIERLTEPGFSHRVSFDPHFQYFIDTFSNVAIPPKVYLRHGDGELVRVISANEVAALAEYQLSEPELVRIPTPAGPALNAMIIRPPNWNPWRKYPVMVSTYAGPHGPSVHNRWGGRSYIAKQFLAQQGHIVWTIDPYSASGEGAVSAWHCYQRLGVTELADLEASLRWLAEHENADLERVGIEGYSYGGFMVAYALTHSEMFKLGIAGLTVSDWRNYDSIYTEMFMRTPENNPAGYEQSSVVAAADQLHGRLLLVHGALDDNVHLQNVMQLMHALEQAGRDFEVLIYPRDGHGLHNYRSHWRTRRLDFIMQNL